MPRWNLDDLYVGPGSPRLAADLAAAERRARAFRRRHQGRLEGLGAAALGRAITAYEAISETLTRATAYAQLLFAANMADPEVGRFHQGVQERVNAITTQMLFFTLEINRLDDAHLARMMRDRVLARYRPWVREVRVFRPHQLGEDMESLLHEKFLTGRGAWTRLFDETLAQMRFPVGAHRLTLSETLNRLSDHRARVRRAAARSLGRTLGAHERLFALITNTLAKDKAIEDARRRYQRPISERNLANQVEDEVIDALVEAVRRSFADLGHRYYRLKARWFGARRLDYWDRNAPLPDSNPRRYRWDEARELVLGAYRAFSPTMADVAGRFFERGWIDAGPRPGKDSGAFAHSTVPSVHPYILMNFHGRARDVATLAHELGHGIHQTLAAPHGLLMAEAPLTLAETASVFGEMLAFRAMLEAETEPRRRWLLVASKVEDMLNTVVRQVAFHEFERRVHDERRRGELAPRRLGELWLEVQTESLGPALRFDDAYRHYWAYIPHFVHSPFYVYAYAFGECLVNSLYDVFRRGHEGFQAKYLDLLRAGGTLRHRELLAPFGLDAGDPAFWGRGLSVVSGLIDELEAAS